ncbi:MAG: hypothetical protein JRJ49_06020 [Deltaproteobacteria bacterium]|nr:hypothetical protein [Deltaproteobacteria bacterium]
MSQYEEALFEYFTKEENFIAAYEISDIFPKVKKKLVEDFWFKAKDLIEEKLKSLPEDYKKWEVKISDDISDKESSLSIQLKDNHSIMVKFEKLLRRRFFTYYGLWVDRHNDKLDRGSISKHADKIKAIKELEGEEDGRFIKWDYTNENFEDIETLKKNITSRNACRTGGILGGYAV